jgi:hypothetical protein
MICWWKRDKRRATTKEGAHIVSSKLTKLAVAGVLIKEVVLAYCEFSETQTCILERFRTAQMMESKFGPS